MPKLILTTLANAEELLSTECASILALNDETSLQQKPGQVWFDGTIEDAYKLCLHSRLANRVLLVLAEGKIDNAENLYDVALGVDWPMVFSSHSTFSIHAKGTNRFLNNTQFTAQKVKDAVVDSFIESGESRPQVDRQHADITFVVRVHRNQVQICLDMSHTSLHLRGYRSEQGEAPIKENVAMMLLYRSGWMNEASDMLFDPLCGSGTILIEAAQVARNIPANLQRQRWGFDHYLGHKQKAWDMIKQQANEGIIKKVSTSFLGTDIDHEMIEIAISNAKRAQVDDIITFKQGNVLQQYPKTETGLMLSNPPYGERLNSYLELLPLYYQWGKHLKSHFSGWKLGVICSEAELLQALKLRADKRYQIKNGPLDCQFCLYPLEGANLEDFGAVKNDDEFANRIKKNLKRLKKWITSNESNAYRVYDADLPNYNFAIDKYNDWVIVQEYKAPKTIPEKTARARLQHAVMSLPAILDVDFSKVAIKVREKQKGTQQYNKLETQNTEFVVYENGAQFLINPTDYLDVGLFLDHRLTRQIFAQKSKGKDVLNLFCYTGSVSVHAARAGAKSVTSVDMSKTYLDWAKRNFNQNRLKGAYAFEQADCLQWVKDASQNSQKRFDAIFVDPPSFSNSKRMQSTWDVQTDHVALLTQLKQLLTPDGFIMFSNNLKSFVLDEAALVDSGLCIENITSKTIPYDFERNPKIHACWILKQ